MPESTLTPAPVIVVTFPEARKLAIRSAATAGLVVFVAVVDDRIAVGMVGTEMRIAYYIFASPRYGLVDRASVQFPHVISRSVWRHQPWT